MFTSWFNKNYEINENNKIKQIGKNRYFSEKDIYFSFKNVCEMACIEIDFDEKDVSKLIKPLYTTPTQTQTTDPKKIVQDWLFDCITHKVFNINGSFTEIQMQEGDVYLTADTEDIMNKLTLYNYNKGLNIPQRSIKSFSR